MKQTYSFSGHTDYSRRFSSLAEPIGNLESGKCVWAWRDGLWIIEEHCGASVSYLARRVSTSDVKAIRDTKAAKQALLTVANTLMESAWS